MQNHIKYLVVENETEWAKPIGRAVRDYFETKHRFTKAFVASVRSPAAGMRLPIAIIAG